MTVGELRKELEKCDEDAPVLTLSQGRIKLWPAGVRPEVVASGDGCGLWTFYNDPRRESGPSTVALLVVP